jgi:outer membrane protein insertion porin family
MTRGNTRACILSVLLLLCHWAGADGEDRPVIHGIDIQGHRVISSRAILKRMSTKEGQLLNAAALEADVQELLRWYRDEGYLLTRISPDLDFSPDSSRVKLLLRLEEGPLIRIGQMDIQGSGSFTREFIRGQMDLHPGTIFRGALLEDDLERLLAAYENNGHPYCQIQVTEFQITPEDRLDFQVVIEQGPQVWIQSVEPQGNTITKAYVIRRELRIKEDQLYDQRAIERGSRRLKRLGFFQEVGEIQVAPGSRPDLVVLRVPVVEGRTNTVDGVVGYQPATEVRKGYFTGLLDLSFGNLMGTGRKVEARWNRRDPSSSRLMFAYEEPWPLGLPFTVGGLMQQINRDSLYAQTNLEAQVTAHLGANLTGGVMLGWERVIPDLAGGQDLFRSRTYLLGLRLDLDIRDDPLGPREGGRYQTAIRHRFKENRATGSDQPVQGRVESTEFTVDLEHYLGAFRRHVVALGAHLGEIRSDEQVVPLNEQFKLGGARTLRGYREEQFHGSRVIWTNLEYRLMHGRRSWSFLFLDAGHYFFTRQDPLSGALVEESGEKVGYGLGLRVESRLGILGVDYGLGEGDGLTDGKVHFGVLNEF